MSIYLPEKIKEFVGDQEYVKNEVGLSESEVLIFPDYVLKIQKQSVETDNEYAMIQWLGGKIPTAQIPVYIVEDGMAYTLMTKVQGQMLCTKEYMSDARGLNRIAADGIKKLWSVDISDCPCRMSRLDERLKMARYYVEHGLVDLNGVEAETFGPNGFKDPEELLIWLETNRPEEDLVLTHGDYCLPNIFVKDGEISAFIDLGKMGPADRWQDIAIALRSIHHNQIGYYGGKKYGDFDPDLLLKELGVEMNEEKMKYYLLLDELF